MSALSPLLGVVLLLGQEPKLPKPEPAKELQQLGFLAGRWEGQGQMSDGTKYADEFVYTWNDHHTFLRAAYTSRVGGQVVWTDDTVIGWDADQKKLVGFTFGMDGSIGRGTVVESKKSRWVIEGRSSGPTPFKEWRMTLTKVDDETLTS